LQLRLAVEQGLIGFYREDSGEKLLIPDELREAIQEEVKARRQALERAEQAEERAEQAEERAEQMEALLARYRERFGELPQ